MEGLTRLVAESLARHGFDRPLDYRRLHWSRWFRCESHHSLLLVPSKPGVFAIAEEIMDVAPSTSHVGTAALGCPSERSLDISPIWNRVSESVMPGNARPDLLASSDAPRRMLAVTQFYEDEDMAFVLDRMLSHPNPMRDRLASGRYFVRFVVIEDIAQRRSICSALNQWMLSAAEKATGIGSHFASSLELTPATEYVTPPNDAQGNLFADTIPAGSDDAHVATGAPPVPPARSAAAPSGTGSYTDSDCSATAPQLNSGAATNIHCPSPLPSGF